MIYATIMAAGFWTASLAHDPATPCLSKGFRVSAAIVACVYTLAAIILAIPTK